MSDLDAATSSLTIEPSDSLAFKLRSQTAPQAVLTVRNASESQKLAFKVKTTRPMRYLVRPNQGLLAPGGSMAVVVILQQKDCDELLRLAAAERQLANDKFLVQSLAVEDEFYQDVRSKSPKESADELSAMWQRADKKKTTNKKLRCQFLQDDSDEHGQEDARESNVATPEQLSSALLHENATDDPTSVDSDKTSDADFASLRKKYDELVAFTVQLTAQRDVLMNDLEKARQAYQRANAENARKDESTLRHRRPNASPGTTSSAVTSKPVQPSEGFTLFHLAICGLVFYLFGRYYY